MLVRVNITYYDIMYPNINCTEHSHSSEAESTRQVVLLLSEVGSKKHARRGNILLLILCIAIWIFSLAETRGHDLSFPYQFFVVMVWSSLICLQLFIHLRNLKYKQEHGREIKTVRAMALKTNAKNVMGR